MDHHFHILLFALAAAFSEIHRSHGSAQLCTTCVFLSGALEQTLAGVKSRRLPWPAGHLFAYEKLRSSMFKWG